MSHLRAAAPASTEGDRGRVALTKVERYRAGKRVEGSELEGAGAAPGTSAPFAKREDDADVKRTPIAAAVIVKKSDPRLARLAKTDVAEAQSEGRQRHRRALQEATVIRKNDGSAPTGSTSTHVDAPPARHDARPRESDTATAAAAGHADMDLDDVDAQRQARRVRALQAQEARAARPAAETSSEEESDDGSSDYSSGSEGEGGAKLAKPVFVTKGERETIAEKERRAQAEAAEAEVQKKRAAARVKETSSMIAEIVDLQRHAAAAAAKATSHMMSPSDIDTDTDDDAAEEEYQAWTRRELARVKREEAMRDPDAARAEAERAEAEFARTAERGKTKFLQKYYHKGAFFQSGVDDDRGTVGADAIYTRDFTGATGEDKFDRDALPAVMQVKNFGRAGRTKWTHLAAEDTTALEADGRPAVGGEYNAAPEFEKLRERAERKGAGRAHADEFSKPHNTRT